MKKNRFSSKVVHVVIVGYVLLFLVMVLGIVLVYNNLVSFSERKTKDEDLKELVIVSNTISKLFELECAQYLITSESSNMYFDLHESMKPEILANIDTLKQLSADSSRNSKLDTIVILLEKKEKNLKDITALLDSIRRAPNIIKSTSSSIIPHKVNKDIDELLERNNVNFFVEEAADTTVIKSEKKGLFGRIVDAFAGKQDSTVIVDNRPVVTQETFSLVLDTMVNIIRYSEKLDLDKQKSLQSQLFVRQVAMNNTNTMLSSRINELLKGIELEELNKSIQLIREKEAVLSDSQKIVMGVSVAAVAIALIFGLFFIVGINKDAKRRRDLELSNKKIKELLELREKLMLAISHDIKAPASSIQGYIELLSSNQDEEKNKKYLQNIKKSSDHILDLVTDMLDARKLSEGIWIKREIKFNLYELSNDVVSLFIPIAQAKKLELKIINNIPENLHVFSDPYMIKKIFNNIISNAIKYTSRGFVEVSYGIENNGVEFVVKDSGCGIAEENQSVIFQEFKQVSHNYSGAKIEGIGLGLAIVKGLVEELNGTIQLFSELDKGSQFTIWLPLKHRDTVIEEDDSEITRDFNLEGISVFAVDDDPVQLTMLSELLKLKKIDVTTESVPENAIGTLSQTKFDIILIDIQMPIMNGLDLVKLIPGLNKSTPKIALSANSEISLHEIRSHGFDDFLSKPFDSVTIMSFIAKYVNNNDLQINRKGSKPHGEVSNLIDFVKEDKDSSLEILSSFEKETSESLSLLQKAFEEKDINRLAQIAHKQMPLFKIINDDELVGLLSHLELKQSISKDDEKAVLRIIENYIKDAKTLINEVKSR